MSFYSAYYQRLKEGEVKGVVRPFDEQIRKLRLAGLSCGAIGRQIGKPRGYVAQRLFRIAAREDLPT